MKKLTILVLGISLAVTTKAQQTSVLKQKYLPKHTYSINDKNEILVQVTMHSDSMAKATGGNGDENMEMKLQTETNTDLKTAQVSDDKSMPFAMCKTIVFHRVAINNQELPPQPDLLAGKTINGTIGADGKVHADTTKSTAEVNSFIKGMVETLPTAIELPDKQFKVGDTFTRLEPGYTVDLTNQGIKKQFTMNVTYKLTDIKDNQLSFETSSEFGLNHDARYQDRDIKIAGKGTSKGKLVFDSGKSYPLYKGAQILVNFEVKSDKALATFKGTVMYETKAAVSAN